MKGFNGRTVGITHGAIGIGFSFAKQFSNDGAKAVVALRRPVRV